MGKYLSRFSKHISEERPDILPPQPSMSGMSVPFSGLQPEKSPLTKDISAPPSRSPVSEEYCSRCGGGYWIRPTVEASYQCGRCVSSAARVETLFYPGGTRPPSSHKPSIGFTQDSIIEPAPSNAKPIYWETGYGRILGPATPEFLVRSGNQFWIVTSFEGQARWFDTSLLRSHRAFLTQSQNRHG